MFGRIVFALIVLLQPAAHAIYCNSYIKVDDGYIEGEDSRYALAYDLGRNDCDADHGRCVILDRVQMSTYAPIMGSIEPSIQQLLKKTNATGSISLCATAPWCDSTPKVKNQESCTSFAEAEAICCCATDACTGSSSFTPSLFVAAISVAVLRLFWN